MGRRKYTPEDIPEEVVEVFKQVLGSNRRTNRFYMDKEDAFELRAKIHRAKIVIKRTVKEDPRWATISKRLESCSYKLRSDHLHIQMGLREFSIPTKVSEDPLSWARDHDCLIRDRDDPFETLKWLFE